MKLTKMVSGALAAALMATTMYTPAFAAEADLANGDYTGTIHFLNGNGSGNKSMCDPIFVHEADVELTDDGAELTFYVAYPIPAFAGQGADGTVKDVTMTIDGQTYNAVSDIDSKPEKTFDTAGDLFGINEGDTLPTQVLTVDLPRSAVDNLEQGVETSAYVNVFMNMTQSFYVQVTDLKAADNDNSSEETTEQSMEITAEVAEKPSEPTYTVTVPSAVSMGTLSSEAENKQAYDVTVKAADLNGTLSVKAPESGTLNSGKNTLEFKNSFATQTVTQDTDATTLKGELSVAGSAVEAAEAGNYTGTTTFSITYAAQK